MKMLPLASALIAVAIAPAFAQTTVPAPPTVPGTPALPPVVSPPSGGLVTVNLQNVLNDLSIALNISQTNIPITAQVPIDVAANVCGVSVNALAVQAGNGGATCTAQAGNQTLYQIVSQQMISTTYPAPTAPAPAPAVAQPAPAPAQPAPSIAQQPAPQPAPAPAPQPAPMTAPTR